MRLEDLVAQEALPEVAGPDAPVACPSCESERVRRLSHCHTLVGTLGGRDLNHHWTKYDCQGCSLLFTFEYKDGRVWYTGAGNRVLRGLPACFEAYVLTCRACGADVVKEHREPDGTTVRRDGVVVVGQTRTFWRCVNCGAETEVPL